MKKDKKIMIAKAEQKRLEAISSDVNVSVYFLRKRKNRMDADDTEKCISNILLTEKTK